MTKRETMRERVARLTQDEVEHDPFLRVMVILLCDGRFGLTDEDNMRNAEKAAYDILEIFGV